MKIARIISTGRTAIGTPKVLTEERKLKFLPTFRVHCKKSEDKTNVHKLQRTLRKKTTIIPE